MKLLFVHQKLGEFGGAEASVELAASGLGGRGHSVSLLYEENTGRQDDLWRQRFEECFCLPGVVTPQWIDALLDRVQPDAIFAHNFSRTDALEMLFRAGIPVVRMVHDHSLYCLRTYKYHYFSREICTRALSGYCVFPCLGSIARERSGGIGIKWASLSKKKRELELTKRFDAILAYSDYQRRELVRNGFASEKIFLSSPMRAPGGPAQSSSFNERNVILYAGQIIRGKGVDALLQALTKIHTRFECLIAGDGTHRSLCERLARKLGLADRVRFCGYVPPAELKGLYADASVFVMSSLWPEPFGMAGPEAMRCGLPVVAFDAGGIGEWLHDGENGYVVPWRNTDAFAERIERLLKDKALARRLGAQGRESVRRLEGSQQLDVIEAVLKTVARKSPELAPEAGNRRKNSLCV